MSLWPKWKYAAILYHNMVNILMYHRIFCVYRCSLNCLNKDLDFGSLSQIPVSTEDACIHWAGNNDVWTYTAMDHCSSTSQLAFVTLYHLWNNFVNTFEAAVRGMALRTTVWKGQGLQSNHLSYKHPNTSVYRYLNSSKCLWSLPEKEDND